MIIKKNPNTTEQSGPIFRAVLRKLERVELEISLNQ